MHSSYDSDEERLRAIHNYLFDLLRRADATANDINKFLGSTSSFDFKYVNASLATSPAPFAQEGGRQAATIMTSYEYTNDMDGNSLSNTFGMRL